MGRRASSSFNPTKRRGIHNLGRHEQRGKKIPGRPISSHSPRYKVGRKKEFGRGKEQKHPHTRQLICLIDGRRIAPFHLKRRVRAHAHTHTRRYTKKTVTIRWFMLPSVCAHGPYTYIPSVESMKEYNGIATLPCWCNLKSTAPLLLDIQRRVPRVVWIRKQKKWR